MPKFDINQYDTVADRIEQFYEDHKPPDGRITTILLSDANNIEEVVVQASVYVDSVLCSTGLASERRGKSESDRANFGSHIENCETSAIGRALANLNYKAKKESPRPSREEMEHNARERSTSQADSTVHTPQRQPTPATQAIALSEQAADTGVPNGNGSEEPIDAHKAMRQHFALRKEFGIVFPAIPNAEIGKEIERFWVYNTLLGMEKTGELKLLKPEHWMAANRGLKEFGRVAKAAGADLKDHAVLLSLANRMPGPQCSHITAIDTDRWLLMAKHIQEATSAK